MSLLVPEAAAQRSAKKVALRLCFALLAKPGSRWIGGEVLSEASLTRQQVLAEGEEEAEARHCHGHAHAHAPQRDAVQLLYGDEQERGKGGAGKQRETAD